MMLCNDQLVKALFALGIRTSSYSKSCIAGRISGPSCYIFLRRKLILQTLRGGCVQGRTNKMPFNISDTLVQKFAVHLTRGMNCNYQEYRSIFSLDELVQLSF